MKRIIKLWLISFLAIAMLSGSALAATELAAASKKDKVEEKKEEEKEEKKDEEAESKDAKNVKKSGDTTPPDRFPCCAPVARCSSYCRPIDRRCPVRQPHTAVC